MVKLGILNSRMKDFYDIWFLSRMFDFTGVALSEAIKKTFKNRKVQIPIAPQVFDPMFPNDADKQVQWRAFIKKAKLKDAPETFEEVVSAITGFLQPIINSLADRRTFRGTWSAPGRWR